MSDLVDYPIGKLTFWHTNQCLYLLISLFHDSITAFFIYSKSGFENGY